MSRTAKLVASCLVFAAFLGTALAQRNARGTAELTLGGAKVSVDYGRPALGTRTAEEMLGKLKPGGFWRLGADQSTTFSTTGDLKFGKVTVPKGEYSIWVKKASENAFELVFNKQHGQWGVVRGGGANRDPKLDVASVPLEESKADKSEDMVTLALAKTGESGIFTIQWGTLKLSSEFQAE